MKYIITIPLYLICLILTAVCGEKPCKRRVDCSQQEKDRACSFCTGNKGSAKCYYPFPDIYQASETHFNCDLVTKCKSNPCKNGGTCVMNIGIGYACRCAANYFGQNCEFKHDNRLHSFNDNTFYFSIVGILRHSTKFLNNLWFIKSKSTKWMPSLLVLTNEGYFEVFQKNAKDPKKYEASVVFPFKAYKERDNFLVYENNVLGYMTTLQIRGYDHMTEIYRSSYQVFVSYDNVKLECMPVIKLRNCGSTFDTATVYIRKSEIILKARKSIFPQGNLKKEIKTNPTCDPKKIKVDMFWEVFLIGSADEEEHASISRTRHNDNSFQFKPFELDFGHYWVNLDATILRENRKSYNTAYGFFKINSLALQPNIEKGSKRIISSIAEGWVMNAKNSKDPNQPPNKRYGDSLMTAWSCTSNLPKSIVHDICQQKILKSTTPYVIPQEKIPDKGIFNFTLEIWSKLYEKCASEYCYEASKHRFINQLVIIDIVEKAFLYLGCEENCLEPMMVYRDIVFKAKVRNIEDNGNVIYNWTYNKVGSKEITSYAKEPECPSYILHLPGNVLKPGVEYTVNVTALVNNTKLFNSFTFPTDTVVYVGNCRVTPEKGVKGETFFDISCPTSNEINFLFEFHDTEEEPQFSCQQSGRMLGVSRDGKLSQVRLTRGIIDICISYYGLYTSRKIIMKLSKPSTPYDIKKYIKELHFHIQTGANIQILPLVSLISDIVDKKMCNNQLINFLLKGIDSVPIKVSDDVKLHSITLKNVLEKTYQLGFYFSDVTTMILTKQIIFDLSKYFNQLKDNFLYFDVKNMTKIVLDSLHLAAKLESKLPNKLSLDSLDTKSLYEVSKTFIMAEETLNNIRDVISYTQMPGLPVTNVLSTNQSLQMLCFKDDPHFNYTLLKMLQSYSDSPVIMTDALYRNIDSAIPWPGSLTFTIISMKENIVYEFNNDSAAELLYLSIGKTGVDLEENPIEAFVNRLKTPIEMKINVSEPQLKQAGNWEIKQLDPGLGEDKLDLLMTIFRLDPEQSSILIITFLFPPSNSSFRVLIMKGYRPTYKMVLFKHKEINEQNSSYSFHCSTSEDDDEKQFYYLAILPGREVPVNKSVICSFSMKNTVCRSWSRIKWSTAGCDVGDITSGHQVHCQCMHLSIFEAIHPYLPTKVNPFSDAILFLTVLDNPLVVCIMISLLVLYLTLSIWSQRMDRIDRHCCDIVILEDNFPGDDNAYLLVVCTSSRFWAGTSANVGIILEGEEGLSRAHILKSSRYKTLNRDSDSWFLLFSPKPLGLLQQVHIWHDNSGFFPSWYCNEIHVYDLALNIETIFIVNQWLELSRENYPEAVILPATPSDVLSPNRLFFNNFISGIKSKQSFVGVFTKHPRGTVTRVELLNLSMCTLMISLLCSIMFYRDPDVNTDDFTFSLKRKEAIVSIITLIASSTLSYIIGFEFQKSYKIMQERNQTSLFLRGNKYDDYLYSKLCDLKNKRRKKDIIMKTLKTVANPASLVPAKLAGGNPVIKIRRCWLTLAWLTCILIILFCVYIIMLYGLKLGLVKSKKWVASVMLSFVASAICISPLVLIGVAVALTSTFNLLVNTTNYQITRSDVLLSLSKDHSDKYVFKLLKKRSHPMYFPPTDDIRAEVINRQKRLYNWLDIFQFCLSVTFMIITYYLAHLIMSSHYYVNSHLAKFIILPRFMNIGFFGAQNISEMNKYAETTFLQALYDRNWYNGRVLEINKNSDQQYWASDFTWKMFGLPIIRQLRVNLESCKNKIFTNISSCIPPWSPSSEDEDRYNVGWLPYTWKDTTSVSPWRYTPPSSNWIFTMYRLCGPSGTMYNKGGYIAQLNPTARESLGTISDLTQNSWQDYFTRVLFMELTFCHTNSQTLSKVTLITEYLVSSVTLKSVHIQSAVECAPWNFSMIAFIIFLFIFFLEICYKINRDGCHCLKDWNNIVLLTITIVGCLVVWLRFINFFQCMWYSFNERNNFSVTSYFDYDSFLTYYEIVGSLLTVPLAASIFRVIGCFRGGDTWNECNRTLALSINGIISLQFVLLLYFVCTWIIFLQTNLYLHYGSFIEIILHSKYFVSFDPHQMTTIWIALKILKFLLSSTIFSCFLILFIHFRGISQSEPKHISYLSFLNHEFVRMLFRINKQKSK